MAGQVKHISARTCPSCTGTLCRIAEESTAEISVWKCPQCVQTLISKSGQAVQFYQRGPFIGPLYALIFEPEPTLCAESLAKQFMTSDNPEDIDFMILACEAELRDPSCQLSEAYDYHFKPTEEQLRAFLQLFVQHLKQLRDQF